MIWHFLIGKKDLLWDCLLYTSIKDAAKQYGVDDYEKFKEIFEKNVSRDTVIENVKRRKAVELLEKNVKLVPARCV